MSELTWPSAPRDELPATAAPSVPSVAPPSLLFDAQCPLCVNLAALIARRTGGAFQLQAWQEFIATPAAGVALTPAQLQLPADRLRLWHAGNLQGGEAAWAFLLTHYPDLQGLAWLAERTGLMPAVARAAERTGGLLRRLCRRCPKPAV